MRALLVLCSVASAAADGSGCAALAGCTDCASSGSSNGRPNQKSTRKMLATNKLKQTRVLNPSHDRDRLNAAARVGPKILSESGMHFFYFMHDPVCHSMYSRAVLVVKFHVDH